MGTFVVVLFHTTSVRAREQLAHFRSINSTAQQRLEVLLQPALGRIFSAFTFAASFFSAYSSPAQPRRPELGRHRVEPRAELVDLRRAAARAPPAPAAAPSSEAAVAVGGAIVRRYSMTASVFFSNNRAHLALRIADEAEGAEGGEARERGGTAVSALFSRLSVRIRSGSVGAARRGRRAGCSRGRGERATASRTPSRRRSRRARSAGCARA